jgi:MFS family permease
MRALIGSRDYRLLFAALVATAVGDLLLTLMLAVWVQKITGSDGEAGITFGCAVFAYAISPLIAWPVDRFRRRPFLISVNVATAGLLSLLLTVHGPGRIWIIYLVAAGYGMASVAAVAAARGLIGLIVPAESVPDAYAAQQTARQSLTVFVPIVGVALYARLGPGVVVVMTIGALLLAAAATAAIRVPETRLEPTGQRWLTEMSAGVRQLATDPVLARLTIGGGTAMLAGGAFAVLGFAVVTEGLHKTPDFLSVLFSLQAVTAIVGATASARIMKRFGEVATASVSIALCGAGCFLTVFPSLPAVAAGYMLAGFGFPVALVSVGYATQRRTPAHLLGRTMVALTSAQGLPQAISITAVAALVAIVDFRVIILICVAIAMLASAYVWRGRALTQPAAPAESAHRLPAKTGLRLQVLLARRPMITVAAAFTLLAVLGFGAAILHHGGPGDTVAVSFGNQPELQLDLPQAALRGTSPTPSSPAPGGQAKHSPSSSPVVSATPSPSPTVTLTVTPKQPRSTVPTSPSSSPPSTPPSTPPPTSPPPTSPPPTSPPPTSPPPSGTLTASPSSVTLGDSPDGGYPAGTFTLTASGGPVTYSIKAPADSELDLKVSPSSGELTEGESVTVTVTWDASFAMSTKLKIAPGELGVEVTYTTSTPTPPPSSTPVPTPAPGPAPSPDPS